MIIRPNTNNKYEAQVSQLAEGIDTISLEVNRDCVDKLLWSKNKNFSPAITLRQRGGMRRFFIINVQVEALELSGNLFDQMLDLLVKLQREKIINVPNAPMDESDDAIFRYFFQHIRLIAKLTALDFFFDFKRNDIQKYDFQANYPESNYSIDHKRSMSLWIIYDRMIKLIHDRHIKREIIDRMPYPMRLEMRLRRQNCDYLNLFNIMGSYQDIIFRFRNFIAKSWRKYNEQIGKPKCTDYHFAFCNILWLSQQDKIPFSSLAVSDSCFV
jgi:hypothetical protein